MNSSASKSPFAQHCHLQRAADARERTPADPRGRDRRGRDGPCDRACSSALRCRACAWPACRIARRSTPSAPSRKLASPSGKRRTHRARRRRASHAAFRCSPTTRLVLTRCDAIDLIVEVTGTVDFGASVVLDAFKHGKPVVMVNAELDSLIGPILKTKADEAGVVLTHTDGDEPGVAMTLVPLRSVGRAAPGRRREHQGHGRLLPNPRYAARIRRKERPGCQEGDVLCRRDEVVHGNDGSGQRDRLQSCPSRNVRSRLRIRA